MTVRSIHPYGYFLNSYNLTLDPIVKSLAIPSILPSIFAFAPVSYLNIIIILDEPEANAGSLNLPLRTTREKKHQLSRGLSGKVYLTKCREWKILDGGTRIGYRKVGDEHFQEEKIWAVADVRTEEVED